MGFGCLLWHFHFLCLLLFHFHFQSLSSNITNSPFSNVVCQLDQSNALLQFKNSFSINSLASNLFASPKTDSWKEGTDCCFFWDGVSCDFNTGYVIGLNLSNSMLYGNFHSNNSLFTLHRLQKLDLSWNDFRGSKIPSQIGHLLSLTHLNLNHSNFDGQIPLEIGQLSNLVSLDLSWNYDLTLETTASFDKLIQNLTKLQELDLSYVDLSLVSPNSFTNISTSLSSLRLVFSGLKGKFPNIIIQRPHLEVLHLGYNEGLTGSFPKSNWSHSLYSLSLSGTKIPVYLENDFFKNLKFLQVLGLGSCNFIGSNLDLFGNLSKLIRLDLSNNNFTGQIPSSIGNLDQLNLLNLDDNNFSGSIPPSFANLSQLNYLYMTSNNINGPIPSSIGDLDELFGLDLSYNNFSGPIPSSFANLNQLVVFTIENNNVNGQIPNYLTKFSRLKYLSLSHNQLSGTIPLDICKLSSLWLLYLSNNLLNGQVCQFKYNNTLRYVDLSHNKLFGTIPSSIFNQVDLRVLILSSNKKLTGEIPSAVCDSKSLQILDLSSNNFSGPIPQCLGNFSSSLSVLHLGMNNFNGVIPQVFSEGSNVRYLNFNGNQLQGKISTSISNCKDLEILDLGNNEIEDTFPYFLQNLQKLQILQLRSNKLYGMVNGHSIANYSFPKLRVFDLSSNNFSGPLPAFYFNNFDAMINVDENMRYMRAPNISYDFSVRLTWKGLEIELVKIQTLLTTIDLSGNNFTGKIPRSIGNLKALKQLNVSHNHLTGNIEPSIGNLTNLETLDLSSNNLTGRIPIQLATLTSLGVFRVSHNQLEGPIPTGHQFNTFDNSSYEGNTRLCGFPLLKACNSSERQQITTPSGEEDSNSDENGFGWKSVFTGYACGAVFGLAIGYIVFKTRKPAWLVKLIEGEGRPRLKRSINNTGISYQRRRS